MLIDANLNFKQHVDKLLVKISKRIGVFGRIRNNLTVDAANKVYQSLVLLVMDYSDVAWSSIGKIEHKDSDAKKILKWLPLSMTRDIPCAKSLVKPGFTRVQAWLNQPGFSGFQTRLTRLYPMCKKPG